MSSTRSSSASTVRCRRSQNGRELNTYVPTLVNGPRTMLNSQSPSTSLNPSSDPNRLARVNSLQNSYDRDSEVHRETVRQKQLKKLNDKLKRYQGVGNLGNKMSQEQLSEEARVDGHWRSRDSYQFSYDTSASTARNRREEEEVTRHMQRLSLQGQHPPTAQQSGGSAGHVLGGNSQYNRASGDHPLLAKLRANNQQNQC